VAKRAELGFAAESDRRICPRTGDREVARPGALLISSLLTPLAAHRNVALLSFRAGAPVYGWDTLVLLKHLLEQGLTKTAIATRLGISRRLVYYLIETGQLDRDLSEPIARRGRTAVATKLDPYHGIITARLATYPELSAIRLFDECRAAGYDGGITQLRDYVQRVRPHPEPEPLVRFETPPGHQAQLDFADFRFPWGKRYALMVVLGYSRLLWIRFYPRKTMRVVMTGLEEAFAYFEGVPLEILFDQMKGVILEDTRGEPGGKLLENPEFLRFATHWSFRIRACRPYRAKTKGKIERPVAYVRGNFIYGREFLGDADLADQGRRWLDETANVRVHGTTRELPRVRFERDERAALQPLAVRPYCSLVLPPERPAVTRLVPPARGQVDVEHRTLTAYAQLAAEVA
jgi:transposase